MRIQVNRDSSVTADIALSEFVEADANSVSARFAGQISRAEIHLSDLNGGKSGGQDKPCLLEARAAGQDPVVVTREAATVEIAVRGATQKMGRLLSSRFGRLEASK